MTTFFTSDTHFGHQKILVYCKRPFASVEENDEALIANWNAVVGKGDTVYHLGDFGFGTPERFDQILSRLSGQKFFLRGNHDKGMTGLPLKHFVWVRDYFELKVDVGTERRLKLVLGHYPIESWNGRRHGSIHLHGHCVDMATEILTEHGWCTRSAVNPGDRLVSLNLVTGVSELDTVEEIVDVLHTGNVCVHEGKSIDFRVTEDHTMVHGRQLTPVLVESVAADLMDKTKVILVSSLEYTPSGLNLPPGLLKLYVLLAADGTVKPETNLCRFRLWKARKQDFLKGVLHEAGVEFKVIPGPKGELRFSFYLPDALRDFNIKGLDSRLQNATRAEFLEILEAYAHSDGTRNGTGILIHSQKECEIDLLQQLAVCRGFSATKGRRFHGFGDNEQFQLSVYPKSRTSVNTRERGRLEQVVNEPFWCIKNRNQNFLMRRNGKVHLTGNCHGTLPSDERTHRLDVGVDVHNYTPISLDQVLEHMKTKSKAEDTRYADL